MNEEFDIDELRSIIQNELNREYTIDEAIKEREEENKTIKESFDALWKGYDSVSELRKEAIKNFKIVKIKMILSNILVLLIKYDIRDEVFNMVHIINKSESEIRDNDELLKNIKTSINKLQSLLVYNCNYDLANLLSDMYDRISIIYEEVCSEMNCTAARIRGFQTQGKSFDESKKEIDDRIEEYVLKLGLKR